MPCNQGSILASPGVGSRVQRAALLLNTFADRLAARGTIDAAGDVDWYGFSLTADQPLDLTTEDSGADDAPITYRARKGDSVHLVGGRRVTGWKPVSDPAVLRVLCDGLADAETHKSAAWALGQIGPKAAAALPALSALVVDDSQRSSIPPRSSPNASRPA